MGLTVPSFTYNSYTYNNTYHRVGILKRDKARKLMTILIYVYKDKATRDENALNNFLVLRLECSKGNFCNYFDHVHNPIIKDLSIEMQCYLYLKNNVQNLHGIDYTNVQPVFEDNQQEEYDAYMEELQAQQEAQQQEESSSEPES